MSHVVLVDGLYYSPVDVEKFATEQQAREACLADPEADGFMLFNRSTYVVCRCVVEVVEDKKAPSQSWLLRLRRNAAS